MTEEKTEEKKDNKFEKEKEIEMEEKGPPFFPNHFLKEVSVIYFVIGIILTLAIILPFGLHEKADPLNTPLGVKPEWYFLPMYQALKYVPEVIGVIGMGIIGFLFMLTPFIDSILMQKFKKNVLRTIGIIGVIVILTLSLLGYFSESIVEFRGKKYEFDLKGIPHLLQEEHTIMEGEK